MFTLSVRVNEAKEEKPFPQSQERLSLVVGAGAGIT